MADDQRHGRIFGVLFIITFLTSIPAYLIFESVLDDPWVIGGTGGWAGSLRDPARVLPRPLERRDGCRSLSDRGGKTKRSRSATSRLESSSPFITVGIITRARPRDHARGRFRHGRYRGLAGRPQGTGRSCGPRAHRSVRERLVSVIMYRSRLVPRRMAWLGLIGGPILFFSNLGVLFDWWEMSACVLVLPEAVGSCSSASTARSLASARLADRPTELARQRDSRMSTGSTPTPADRATNLPLSWQRLLALSGVAFAVLFIIGWFASGGDAPDYGASDQAWTDWADDNQWKSRIGAVAMLLAGFVFLHFAGMIEASSEGRSLRLEGLAARTDCLRRSRNGHDRNGYRHRHHRFVELRRCEREPGHHEGGRECVGRSILGFGDGVCSLPRGCGTPRRFARVSSLGGLGLWR